MKNAGKICVLFFLFGYAQALKCYNCDGCPPDILSFLGDQENCGAGIVFDPPKCLKIVDAYGNTARRCAASSECAATQLIAGCSPNGDTSCFTCCDTDLCNNASSYTVSITAALFSVIVAVYNCL